MNEILTPTVLWSDFNENYTGKIEEIPAEGFRRFLIPAFSVEDGEVIIDTEIYFPDRENGRAVLLLGDFARKAQMKVIRELNAKGITVVLPDYSGVFAGTGTTFPKSLEYGFYEKGGEHLTKVCHTARETSYFLYARVVRKIISALKNFKPSLDIVLMGLKRGTEIALQVAGTDKRIIGLALVAGAGYREYVDYPKYCSTKMLSVEGDLMSWITTVSGTAYAKKVTVPTIIALGSNGTSDIDRVPNLMGLIQAPTALTVSVGYRDNIDGESFETLVKWLEKVFLFSLPPDSPVIKIKVNDEGKVYADIDTDDCIKIKEVRIKYSYGNNNHTTRSWDEVIGEYIGKGNYIAQLEANGNMLFAYPEVEYANGLTLDGAVVYFDLSGNKTKVRRGFVSPIVFQHPDESAFVEISDDAVIFESSLKEKVIPVGLKGICCDEGAMVTYAIGEKTGFDETRLLQIDTYSDRKTYYLTIGVVDGDNVEYTAVKEVECSDTFSSLRLPVNAFKAADLHPLESWEDLKSLTVHTEGVVVGKIMFL